MRDIEILAVTVEHNEVVVSLAGGTDNVVGTLRFYEKDSIKLHNLRRRAEDMMNGGVLVDLAISMGLHRWRLIGKNACVIGGTEPTKLELSKSNKPNPKKIDEGGLGWPEAWGGEY